MFFNSIPIAITFIKASFEIKLFIEEVTCYINMISSICTFLLPKYYKAWIALKFRYTDIIIKETLEYTVSSYVNGIIEKNAKNI